MPIEVAEQIQLEADRLEVSYSEYIAHVLGRAHGFEVPLTNKRDQDQKELPLTG